MNDMEVSSNKRIVLEYNGHMLKCQIYKLYVSNGALLNFLVVWFELLVLPHASAVCGTITDLSDLWSSTKNTLIKPAHNRLYFSCRAAGPDDPKQPIIHLCPGVPRAWKALQADKAIQGNIGGTNNCSITQPTGNEK